ncbi:MAG: hypothetical protein JW973_18310 [Bacteroidales bacterium]|nr:hypothetical protein [Bacteroidales bacterium]
MKRTYLFTVILLLASGIIKAQDGVVIGQNSDENKLKISGELLTDERFLLKDENQWAWNENRLTLKFNKRITDRSKFYGEVWLRNIGLPNIVSSSDLYNKGIVDPYNLEIREANIQLYGFLTRNLDLTIGRQRIVWGTADKINPTDNLNPYDMEDVLDFGRHRSSDAVNANYYFTNDFSLQAVYIPFFQPANMPVGMFANILSQPMELPQGMTLTGFSDNLQMPRFNLGESSTAGLRFKGYVKAIDFSLSYVWGYDGLPVNTKNTITPVDTLGGVTINSQLSFMRTHCIGADFATSIAGIGFWGEAAVFIPDEDVVMTTDLSALYPLSPVPVITDTTIIDKPYIRFIVGADYNFSDGSYLNVQYLHGFIHERGGENLDDYFFMRYEKRFFSDRLKIAPIGGAFIVTDWSGIKDNYALAYIPQVSYNATDDVEITLSAAIFDGKGDNLFAGLKDYDMFMFKVKYNF